MVLSVAAAPAKAVEVEVIEQLLMNSYNSPNNFRQTFTPTVSGFIKIVGFQTIDSNGPGLLNIFDGNGGGPVVHSENVIWVDNTFQNVELSTAVPVTAGQIYTLEATETGLGANFTAADAYVGGEAWIFRQDLGGIWQTWTDCALSGWCSPGEHDMTFRVVIEDDPVAVENSEWGALKALYR